MMRVYEPTFMIYGKADPGASLESVIAASDMDDKDVTSVSYDSEGGRVTVVKPLPLSVDDMSKLNAILEALADLT